MKTPEQRQQKRWKRENRHDKGVSTEAARQAHNAAVRAARNHFGASMDMSDHMLLAAAEMIGRKR